MTKKLQVTSYKSSQSGTTLIEVLIYILLLAFIMSAVLISVNQILSYNYSAASKISVEQEAAFIIAKINWALDNSDIVLPVVSGPVLKINKTGYVSNPITFAISGSDITMSGTTLNIDRVTVSSLSFDHTQQTGTVTVDTIKTSFYIDGRYFETYKSVR